MRWAGDGLLAGRTTRRPPARPDGAGPWLQFSVVSVGATTWAVCDGLGRAETAAAAIDEGRVVAPAPEVPRWLRNLPRRGAGGASGPDEP